jgi:ribonuclease HII
MEDLHKYEHELNEQGIKYIAGIDEVGRGPLVGPVVCACVVLPVDYDLKGLTDSKKLTPKKRDYFYDIIKENAIGIGIGVIDEKRIDEINIYQATKEGMVEAFNNVKCKIEHVLIDAMPLELTVPSTSIIKGDSKSITIAAASVIAKVTRDRMMDELDNRYPMYGFKRHKGYPTKEHIEAINKYGIIDEHRKSYGPVMSVINKQ